MWLLHLARCCNCSYRGWSCTLCHHQSSQRCKGSSSVPVFCWHPLICRCCWCCRLPSNLLRWKELLMYHFWLEVNSVCIFNRHMRNQKIQYLFWKTTFQLTHSTIWRTSLARYYHKLIKFISWDSGLVISTRYFVIEGYFLRLTLGSPLLITCKHRTFIICSF